MQSSPDSGYSRAWARGPWLLRVSAAAPGSTTTNRRKRDTKEDREESGMSCSLLGSVPGCRNLPVWFPRCSQSINPQAEKSTFVFLGDSLWRVPVGASF